jgi:NADH-ubiquinone oxidoreductase chain 5
LAGITKSAQIPFSAWLPAAMAAPTPVSALVHSSTLVTAGVYLLIRFHYLLSLNNFLFFIGTFTIFISGLGANYETDLKKIIALSTLRQLGVIIITLSLGFYELSFFHLLRHALFKSLLFLCAGVFIHSVRDIQDIRFLGGLEHGCPIRSFYFTACSLSLCGFPFISGFYSKDSILENFIIIRDRLFILLIILVGTIFTVTYSVRLGYYLFFKNLGVKRFLHIEEHSVIIIPMRLLFVLAVSAGRFISWVYFPCYLIYIPFIFKSLILFCVIIFSLWVYEVIYFYGLSFFYFFNKWAHYVGSM